MVGVSSLQNIFSKNSVHVAVLATDKTFCEVESSNSILPYRVETHLTKESKKTRIIKALQNSFHQVHVHMHVWSI